jgi:hypothetical protein
VFTERAIVVAPSHGYGDGRRGELGAHQRELVPQSVGDHGRPRAHHERPEELSRDDNSDSEDRMSQMISDQDLRCALQPGTEVRAETAKEITAEPRIGQQLPGGAPSPASAGRLRFPGLALLGRPGSLHLWWGCHFREGLLCLSTNTDLIT